MRYFANCRGKWTHRQKHYHSAFAHGSNNQLWCDIAKFPSNSVDLFFIFPTSVCRLLDAVDCLDPTCSNNGICVNGECHCKPGWGGLHCELPRAQCPDQCHGHGAFIPDTGLCSCDPNWMGPDCSMGKCTTLRDSTKRQMLWGMRKGQSRRTKHLLAVVPSYFVVPGYLTIS